MKRLGFITGAIIVFLWSPLVFIFAKGFNVDAFSRLLADEEILWALGQSLLLATATCVVSTVLGTLTAFAMPRLGTGMRRWVSLGLFIPMILPEIAFGISYLVWYIKLGLSLGWITLFMSHIAFTFCYATLVMKTRVDAFDSSLLDAGRDLGARKFKLFRHAVLPQLTPALIASGLMTFSLSLDDFLISFFVKGLDQVTLPIKIYSMMKLRIGAEVYALSVVLLTLSLIFGYGNTTMVFKITQSPLISLAIVFAALTACEKKDAGGAGAIPAAASGAVKELRIFTWSEYLKPELIAEFEKENHVKVKTDYFGNNEELLAKIQVSVQSGGEGYDLILPSDYMVGNMISLGLLQPLDKSKITFFKDYSDEFLKPGYDPELKYAVPFAWGTTGIAVNTKLAPKLDLSKGLSWKDIFENAEFKGKTTMLDDAKENLHAALLILGKSWDKATEADVKAAFAYLKGHKKNLRIFTTETRPVVEADECALCQIYSGDALSIASKKPEIKYIIPREGGTIWTDNFAIPKNAKNLDMAYAFLNKLLSAQGSVQFTQKTFYPTPNKASWKLLPTEMQNNPAVFPPKDVFVKLHYLSEKQDLLPVIDRQWTELKTE